MVTRIFIFAALLAGCGGPQFGPSAPSPQAPLRTSGAAPPASGNLVYVSDYNGREGRVIILSLPSGKRLATITVAGAALSPCSDASGNVWVPAYDDNRSTVYEYAHGGTKPIGKIAIPHRYGGRACAVDPTTGNIAVAGNTSINVFPGGVSGKPIHYDLGYVSPNDCAYDSQGNLYFDGTQGSTAFFLLAELVKGASKFQYFHLDKRVGYNPVGLVWDGQHMAVETSPRSHTVIYRFDVSGKLGHVVQTVRPRDLSRGAWFAVLGNDLVGTANKAATGVRVWNYPAGGASIAKFSHRFTDILGLTISVAQ